MPRITLRDQSTVEDPRLDRQIEFDDASWNYPITAVVGGKRPRSYTHRVDCWFDQGQEGACTWFCCGHELWAKPALVRSITQEYLFEQYHLTQHDDQWTGCHLGPRCHIDPSPQAYDGTSMLAMVKRGTAQDWFKEYRWAFTLEDLVLALGYAGPVMLGVNWYGGMFEPGSDGFIHPTGQIMGGHAILAYGVKLVFKPGTVYRERTWADVDLHQSYIKLWNSWGPDWGLNGTCYLRLDDLDKLRKERGEALIPIRSAKR